MADQNSYNLEPVEDKDVDLESKFGLGNEGKTETPAPKEGEKKKVINLESVKTIEPVEKKVEAQKEISKTEREQAYQKIVQAAQKAADDKNVIKEEVGVDAKTVYEEQDVKQKIEKLLNLAMDKGVFHAVEVARYIDDNYVLDELHDRLNLEEFHNALVQKGLLKEIE